MESLLHNQFLFGTMVLGAIAALVASLRRVPGQLWEWILRRYVVDVEIHRDDELFYWVGCWFSKQSFIGRWSLLSAFSYNDENDAKCIGFRPGVGSNLFVWDGRWFIIHHIRDVSGVTVQEMFRFRCLKRNKPVLMGLLEKCRDESRDKALHVHVVGPHGWNNTSPRALRPMDSVVLPGTMSSDLLGDAGHFFDSRVRCAELGLPWRRGYLFEGPPGNGKTSAALALASELRLDVYLLTLVGLEDKDLVGLLCELPSRSMLLLEDLDRQLACENIPSLSAVLNAIDGAAASEGRLLVITANEPEKLCDALTRAGRIDRRWLFPAPDHEQVQKLALRLNRQWPEGPPTSMAAAQELMLKGAA